MIHVAIFATAYETERICPCLFVTETHAASAQDAVTVSEWVPYLGDSAAYGDVLDGF